MRDVGTGQDQIRKVVAVMKNILRHPSTIYKAINNYNLRTFFRVLRENGVGVAFTNALRMMSNYSSDIVSDHSDFEDLDVKRECPLSIPCNSNPLVSIIIPVYNQYQYTVACINSVLDACNGIDVEIILGDDNSSDETQYVGNRVRGLKVVRNSHNLGFLLNCNNAAKYAKGKYILFLNNDTIVGRNWLKSLVDLAESDSKIGLVGSKFIYPDGSLQEAGGILWSDGSAWNYGRGSDPRLPEFNYVKDVDYISGASIMIPRFLFEKIGGFDERFTPAYCEDSDLAFSIRKLGYRTVYQPMSEVIHFEGISNGKTTQSKMKSYQIVNTTKFQEKWKEELVKFHKANGEDVFHARDRSFGKKTILFIDAAVPRFDDNAGNRTVYDYMRTLVSMGYNVKLMPENFYYDPQYTPIYESMGIEVLYGNKYAGGWKSWIRSNSENIEYVMIFRPQCACVFMKYIRKNTSATIIYNIADLHFIRLNREYEVTGNPRCKKEAIRYKKVESKFLNMADRCVTVSADEAELMSRIVDKSKICIYPIFCYDVCREPSRSYVNGNELIFVGSFNHSPNRDAMYWFLNEIFPLVKKELPNVRINIVGSNVPPDLLSFSSDCVIFYNHVSDSNLSDLYRNSSVCVIPLRFGAGVKGKTLEAMYNSIPIVSTSIGIEGMPGIRDYIVPKENAESFSLEIINILSNPEYAKKLGMSYSEYVALNYSRERLMSIFS